MKQLLTSLLTRLSAGESAVLCTILASSGSSPRGAGARMAVFSDGTTLGTVGGGAVEKIAAQQALTALSTGASSLRAFDLSPNQINDIGMICGGAVTVYYQVFSPQDEPAVKTLQKWLSVLEQEQAAWLLLALCEEKVSEFCIYTEQELPEERRALFTAKAQLSGADPLYYTEPISRPGQVYIFGGGHVGTALVPVLSAVDFRVTVFDDRPDFAVKEHYPQAVRVLYGSFENLGLTLSADDCAVIMTPGHQADLSVLKQVLRTDAGYIGCIGSKKKIERTNEALRQAGFTDADIARIHSPIGLDILAETPAEIAVSIAAELIRHRKETV